LSHQLCFPEKSRILDLGSGLCDLWVENKEWTSSSWEILASDFSAEMITAGARRIEAVYPPIRTIYQPGADQFRFVVINAVYLPFEREQWDIILAIGLLDLVADLVEVLEKIQEKLKVGGKFYATAGGTNHLRELEAILSPFLPGLRLGGHPEQFGLENGIRHLAPYFENITLVRYYDDLIFTSVEPIIAFAMSEDIVSQDLGPADRILLERCLADLLKERGEIRITAEKGLFCGVKD
jgi:ubiquinone/menaquinone biosynthesis C-methylase UbiE